MFQTFPKLSPKKRFSEEILRKIMELPRAITVTLIIVHDLNFLSCIGSYMSYLLVTLCSLAHCTVHNMNSDQGSIYVNTTRSNHRLKSLYMYEYW